MTKEEIQVMAAGREMDAMIAEKIMGLSPNCTCKPALVPHGFCHGCGYFVPPKYSTDITVAWQVVEKMNEMGRLKGLEYTKNGDWHAHFDGGWAYADTAPLAICRAALVAVAPAEEVVP